MVAKTKAEKFTVGEHLAALCAIISSNLRRISIGAARKFSTSKGFIAA